MLGEIIERVDQRRPVVSLLAPRHVCRALVLTQGLDRRIVRAEIAYGIHNRVDRAVLALSQHFRKPRQIVDLCLVDPV